MSVIWSGITEEGAVVPVQVTEEGKVVAVGDGPQGDYLPITGGELTGDLEVDGSITATSDVQVGDDPTQGKETGVKLFNSGQVYASGANDDTSIFYGYKTDPSGPNATFEVTADGSITAAGSGIFGDGFVVKKDGNVAAAGTISTPVFSASNYIVAKGLAPVWALMGGAGAGAAHPFVVYNDTTKEDLIRLTADGSITAAGGACGFTSTGELIFSSRGTRYKLFVSQGVCQAEEYTRQMELKEKAELIADKRETKPSDPQPPQPGVTPDNDNA